MTPEAQRIAIAEACGYSDVSFDHMEQVDIDSRSIQMWTQWMGEKHGVRIKVPAYVTDLNAICNAIHTLPSGLRDNTFTSILAMVCGFKAHGVESWSKLHAGRFAVINATAAQRAEAFLRTLGKWEASK